MQEEGDWLILTQEVEDSTFSTLRRTQTSRLPVLYHNHGMHLALIKCRGLTEEQRQTEGTETEAEA